MPHPFILGGSGQIGLATASRIAEAGWTITVAHRGQRGGRFSGTARVADVVGIDRQEPGALARALRSGADVLIDVTAYGPEHARQLLGVQGVVGALVVISSASVYRDEKGRTLDEASETGFPELPVPISERQPTVEPGPETYSTRKVLLERTLLDEAVVPLTILRPAAISGVGSTHAREWWFVKRVLDRRPLIPLAYRGQTVFHTTSAANIGALILRVATLSGKHVLNIADPAPCRSETLQRASSRGLIIRAVSPRCPTRPTIRRAWDGRRGLFSVPSCSTLPRQPRLAIDRLRTIPKPQRSCANGW
jgi:nucleoside-diphosphate-sugar epimerase